MSPLSGTKVVLHYFVDNVENANLEVVHTVNIIGDKLPAYFTRMALAYCAVATISAHCR